MSKKSNAARIQVPAAAPAPTQFAVIDGPLPPLTAFEAEILGAIRARLAQLRSQDSAREALLRKGSAWCDLLNALVTIGTRADRGGPAFEDPTEEEWEEMDATALRLWQAWTAFEPAGLECGRHGDLEIVEREG